MSKHKPSQDPAHGVGSSWGSDLLCLLGVRHSGEIDERDVLGEIGEHFVKEVLSSECSKCLNQKGTLS